MFAKDSPQGNRYDLYRCNSCGQFYFSPVPSAEWLGEHLYNTGYMFDGTYEVGRGRYGTMLDAARTIAPPPCRALDYGSGAGLFSIMLKDAGYDVECYEPSPYARNMMQDKAIKMYTQAEAIPLGRYQLIMCIEVLEHCLRPIDIMRHMRDLLVAGGKIYTTTSLLNDLYGWVKYIEPVQHITFFTRDSVRRMMEAVGFSRFEDMGVGAPPVPVRA